MDVLLDSGFILFLDFQNLLQYLNETPNGLR